MAVADYQRIKTRRERDKLTIKMLKEKEKVSSFERDQTQAVELSLSERIRELEMYASFLINAYSFAHMNEQKGNTALLMP